MESIRDRNTHPARFTICLISICRLRSPRIPIITGKQRTRFLSAKVHSKIKYLLEMDIVQSAKLVRMNRSMNCMNPIESMHKINDAKINFTAEFTTRFWSNQEITPSSFPTLINAAAARSRSSLECAAEICVRIRACPFGTTG